MIAGWNFNSLSGHSAQPRRASTNNSATGTPAATCAGNDQQLHVLDYATDNGKRHGDDVTGTTLSSDPLIVLANNSMANNNIAPNDNNAWRIRGAGLPKKGTVGTAGTGNGWNLCCPALHTGRAVHGEYHRLPLHRPAVRLVHDQPGRARSAGAIHHRRRLDLDSGRTDSGVRRRQRLQQPDHDQLPRAGHYERGEQSELRRADGVRVRSGLSGIARIFDSRWRKRLLSDATGTYTAASLGSNNQPVLYNNNSGNWRFDEVNILGTANNTNPITSDPIINTTGLVNPDGILAVVPNTYPIKVLYISKTLNSDYVPPTSYPLCPPSIPNGNLNDDVEVVRIATTTNFVNFTDITPFNTPAFSNTGSPNAPIQMVNGLSDPSTTSYSGIRWPSPNGTLIQLSNGNWGLFFGGGNCLDGDSDGFPRDHVRRIEWKRPDQLDGDQRNQ